jgi:hypothetical protein
MEQWFLHRWPLRERVVDTSLIRPRPNLPLGCARNATHRISRSPEVLSAGLQIRQRTHVIFEGALTRAAFAVSKQYSSRYVDML